MSWGGTGVDGTSSCVILSIGWASLVGEVDGVFLKGVSGRLTLRNSKSDRRDDGHVVMVEPDVAVS